MASSRTSLFRDRGSHEGDRVESVELFFDLVFVFAVTRLSHALLENLTAAGLLRVGLLIFAVWWVWIYTTWAANWLAPERTPVRLCLFAMMFVGLLLAVSIPRAFGDFALLFALSYVIMQVGRTMFFLWAARSAPLELRLNFQRILIWLALSGVFWIAGGLVPAAQLALWGVAMGIELLGPAVGFWTPRRGGYWLLGFGRSDPATWNISGAHLAERCGLFVIIALGESLLMTGVAFGNLEWNAASLTALASAAIGSVLMWWIYFDTGAARAHVRIAHSDSPGRQGRLAYTYIHTIIIAGIIVCAVADELVLASTGHDAGHGPAWVLIISGPLVYIVGVALFKWVTNDRPTPPLSHLVGIALLLALALPAQAHLLPDLALSIAVTLVLLLVAAWENVALSRPSRRR